MSASAAVALSLAGCAAADGDGAPASELLAGAQETGASVDAITGSYPAGTHLQTTAALNLRSGPSTGYGILLVIPLGAVVTLASSPGPSGGWYHVSYAGRTGWAYGGYLRLAATSGGSTGSSAVDAAIARARAGVGFSYWWGHGRWASSGPTSAIRGACSGNCPSCSHAGSYGADCSGYVAKVWAVPGTNTSLSTDSHPYSTYNFYYQTGGGAWSRINRSYARRGDAMVYHSGTAGHTFVYESGTPWGSMWTYEARGCSYGIVHNVRTASASYVAIRRTGY